MPRFCGEFQGILEDLTPEVYTILALTGDIAEGWLNIHPSSNGEFVKSLHAPGKTCFCAVIVGITHFAFLPEILRARRRLRKPSIVPKRHECWTVFSRLLAEPVMKTAILVSVRLRFWAVIMHSTIFTFETAILELLAGLIAGKRVCASHNSARQRRRSDGICDGQDHSIHN